MKRLLSTRWLFKTIDPSRPENMFHRFIKKLNNSKMDEYTLLC